MNAVSPFRRCVNSFAMTDVKHTAAGRGAIRSVPRFLEIDILSAEVLTSMPRIDVFAVRTAAQ